MSFLDAAAGFATGFTDEMTRIKDIQRAEDREREKELIAAAKAEAKTFSERKRAHEQMLQKSHQLHQDTGIGDPGAFFRLMTYGFDAKDIVNMVQENPNLFTEMGISTTRGQSTGQQSQFDAGIDILDEFGGPTVEAGEALDNRRAQTAGGQGSVRPTAMALAPLIEETANALEMDPVWLATIISFETGGTFNPTQRGPTTQWGQHKGFIQFGEPQARQYGVDWNNPVESQLGANGAIVRYFRANGWQPGMSFMNAYSIVNAGAPNRFNASDANNGGTPGTVADKVNNQMAGHRANALRLFGDRPMRTTMSTSGQIDPTDQQMAGAFSEPTVVPRMEIPQQPEPQQEQSGLDRFRTGFQRVFGMDDESRNQRIQSNVDAFRSRAGLDQQQSGGGGFASMPQSNFRINLTGNANVDISNLIGASETKINQALTYYLADDTPNLTPQQVETLNEMARAASSEASSLADPYLALLAGDNPKGRIPMAMQRVQADIEADIIPADKAEDVLRHMNEAIRAIHLAAFNEPANREQADFRFESAQRRGDTFEADLLWPFTTKGQEESIRRVLIPRDGGLGTVRRVTADRDPETGVVIYRDLITEEVLSSEDFFARDIDSQQDEMEISVVTNPDVNRQITAVQDNATALRQISMVGSSLAKLVGEDERATTAAGRLALAIDNFRNDATSILSLLEDASKDTSISEEQANEILRQSGVLRGDETLESLAGGLTLGGVQELVEQNNVSAITQLANNRRRLEAIVTLGAFRLADSEGQTGRNVSNLFFREFSAIIAGARTEAQIKERLQPQISQLYANYLYAVTALEQNNLVQTFIKRYNRRPSLGPRLEDFMGNTPELADAFDYFGIQLRAPVGAPRSAASQTTTGTPPDQGTPQIPPAAIEFLNENASDPEILRLFEKKYGVPAQQFLSGGQ